MTSKRGILVVLALLAGLFVTLAAASACSSDDGRETAGGGAGDAADVDLAGPGGEAPAQGEGGGAAGITREEADLLEAPVDQASPSSLPAFGPRVVQTATVRLRVARNGFEEAVDEARTVATGLGGLVVSSTASQEGRGRLVSGSLVVRVPSRHYARAMTALGRIGRVEAREESSADVSQEFVDLEARARHLEAVERQFLALLDRARTVSATLAVQSRLNQTQLELEQVRGRLRFLEDQTSYATITLTLREHVPAAERPDGGWGVLDAWRAGARAFVYVGGRAFVIAAAAAPLLLLALVALLAIRIFRRRPLFRWGASRP